MALIYGSWLRAVAVLVLVCLAISVEALPKKKGATAVTQNTGTTTGSTKAAASSAVTTATDGSTILDKTVTIK
jgi:hypothetical protein